MTSKSDVCRNSESKNKWLSLISGVRLRKVKTFS